MIITALPSIATAAGANRVLRGMAITSPLGDPALPAEAETALRFRLFSRAIEMLETDIEPGTVWEEPR